MGNCFMYTQQHIKDIKINICYQNQNSDDKNIKEIIIKGNDNDNYDDNIKTPKKNNKMKKYIENKTCLKKHLSQKKHSNAFSRLSINKYEIMLHKLLDQQNSKNKGPKRRETIRNEKLIQTKIKEVISEEDINKSNNENNEKQKTNKNNEILIKNIKKNKYRLSANFEPNIILADNTNKIIKNNNNQLQYRNTINNEGSAYSGYCKKQTTSTQIKK